jgi:hypothetical protein
LDGRLQAFKKYTEVLVVASKDVWLDVNADKINYMVILRVQNAERNHNIEFDDISCYRVEVCNIFGPALQYENSIQ